MTHRAFSFASLLGCCWAGCLAGAVAWAQSEPGGDAPDGPAAAPESGGEANTEEALHVLQQALLNDYKRFENKLLELAEYERRSDPDRAELLRRARGRSTSLRIAAQMEKIAEALAPIESGGALYGDAESRQEQLLADMVELLKLLQSEDERDRLASEIARIQDILKDTQRIIGQQKDVRADTERGHPADRLESEERRVAEEAQRLADKIDRQDAERRAEEERERGGREAEGQRPEDQRSEGQESEDQRSEDQRSEDQRSEDQRSEDQRSEDQRSEDQGSEGQRSEGQRSEGEQQQSEGQQQQTEGQQQPSQGQQQQQSQGQQQQPQSQQTPGREQLEEARRRMEQAIEELQQEKLDKASDEQDAAIARLEEMKAELEEILRQLREEERKLFLAMLEARFQRMLELQLDINNGTLKLDRFPEAERNADQHLGQATKLSRDQTKNASEAEKALVLLKQEGSSVAFPEAIEMMRDNMNAVSGRLARGLTGETTQLLERLIVEALEEMIFALQREMEKQDQQQQDGEGQQGEPQDPALVDQLAELKMIRSLQVQVNRLTQQYGQSFEGEQATDAEDIDFLQKLGGRQLRIQRATYDLSVGKNR